MKRHRIGLMLVLTAFMLLFSATPAGAHAYLSSATPDININLDKTPVVIELYFSEPVDASFTEVRVLDSRGERVDNDDTTVDANDPTRATATVRSLTDGIYTVSWKVLSLVDSHITSGAYPFAVGDVDAAALEAAQASQSVSISSGEVVFRWLSYLSGAVLSGGVVFVQWVWKPAFKDVFGPKKQDGEPPPWRMLAAYGLILLVGSNILGLFSQTGQVVGQLFAAPWNPATTQLLFITRYGALWLIRFVLILAATYFLARAARKSDYWISFAALLGIMMTFSLNSHAAAEPQLFFPVGADWVHLVASSIWVGGLVYLAVGLLWSRRLEAEERTSLTAALLPRFSSLALLSVGLLGVTGVYSAYLRVGAFEALFTTVYGRVLIVKLLLSLPAFVLGAVNLLITRPNMKRALEAGGDSALVERFRRLVTGEIVALTLLLLSVGVFAAVPPARAIATKTTLEDRAEADDLEIEITITPGNVGMNKYDVLVLSNGQPLEDAKEVVLQFTPTTVDLPPSEAILESAGGGLYSVEGAFMGLPDEWQLQVAVRREGLFDSFANFNFAVGTSASQNFSWNRLTAVLLLIGSVLYLVALRRLEPPAVQRTYLTRVPAAALLIAAVFVYRLPTGLEDRYVNPIPPNRESVEVGKAVYREQCLSCHGPGGRGDGPVGLTLNPPPADLYEHTQPGIHPDGRLYGWISFGFSNSQVMPRFETILTEDERWHVVNFIRTFSQPLEKDAP